MAGFVRYYDLGGVGFNNDEAVYSGQGATLAGYEEFSEHFSIFRAHPLLFQSLAAISFIVAGLSDTAARSVSAGFGVMTVGVTYLIAKVLFAKKEGHDREEKQDTGRPSMPASTKIAIAGSAVIALLPYHIQVTRQAFVDVPFSFFFALTVLMMALFYVSGSRKWLYLVGISAGLSTLSKEVGFLTIGASLICLVVMKQRSMRNILALVFSYSLTISPFIVFIALSSSGSHSGSQYFEWQLARNPNHPASFYFETLGGTLGYVIANLVVLSLAREAFLWFRRRKDAKRREQRGESGAPSGSDYYSLRSSPKILLAIYFVAPFLFFQFWSTKGYHYLHYGVVPLVLIAISLLFEDWTKKHFARPGLVAAAVIVLALLTTDYVIAFFIPSDPTFYAGSGGLPKAREAALWIEENSNPDAVIMTVGPTMGNVIKFYSHRDVVALAIPKFGPHNPAYSPIINPDLSVRNGEVDYLIYDLYSAVRTENLSEKLKYYAEKYNCPPVHIEYETFRYADGSVRTEPVVVVYQNIN